MHSAAWHKYVSVEPVNSVAKGSVNTMPDKPVGVPVKLNSVNIPEPGWIWAPVNEIPTAVEFPTDTINPALAAAPPDAGPIEVPAKLNWNPAKVDVKL